MCGIYPAVLAGTYVYKEKMCFCVPVCLYICIYVHLICTESGYCTFLRQAERANPKSLYSGRNGTEHNSRILQTCPLCLLIVQIKYING